MMKQAALAVGIAAAALVVAAGVSHASSAGAGAVRYDAAGHLLFPAAYRGWTFVTAGHGMSYNAKANDAPIAPFDNVFVSPGADAAFRRTGHWPEGTMFVLELRSATSKGSINLHGSFQSGQPVAIEAHVRDRRFRGGWGFFAFDHTKPAALIGYSESCYACHQAHAAVDTTFVQFYPEQLPVATAKHSFSAAYRAENKP